MTIHEKLKTLRKEKKWSQAELAQKLNVHTAHISRLESPKYLPSIQVLKKIAEVFEVSTDYLLFDTVNNNGSINIQDKSFYEKMRMIENLEDLDRNIISGVIEAFLIKKQMWSVLNKQQINVLES